jgi:hypothetical protein
MKREQGNAKQRGRELEIIFIEIKSITLKILLRIHYG